MCPYDTASHFAMIWRLSNAIPVLSTHQHMVLVLPIGRADYFGTVSNLAARVAGLAAPGQILVEGREAFRRERDWRRQSDAILLLPDPMGGIKGMPGGDTAIELEQIGYYLLKVECRKLQTAPRCVPFVLRPNAIFI